MILDRQYSLLMKIREKERRSMYTAKEKIKQKRGPDMPKDGTQTEQG